MFVKVKGLGEAGALREPMDSNSSFPVILTPSIGFATLETFRHMLERLQIKHVLFRIGVAHLWLGDLDGHIGYKFGELFGCELKHLCGFGLWERILAHYSGIGFLVVNHMLPECLLFVFGTPFVRGNMWPRTVCTFGLFCFFFWVSFVQMVLTTDDTFLF